MSGRLASGNIALQIVPSGTAWAMAPWRERVRMLKTDKYRDRLQEEKARLDRMIESRQASSVQHGSDSINDSFSNSGDSEYADAATETYDHELDLTLLNKYRHRHDAVRAALSRIEEGTYGTCIRCKQAISEGRLEAIPETPYCRECEADVETQD